MWFRVTCLGVCLSFGLACAPAPPPPAPAAATVTITPAPSPPPATPSPAVSEPPTPAAQWSCDDIRLGYCSGAAQWLAGCETEIPVSPARIMRPEVLALLGPCLAAEPATDDACSERLQSCVHESVMAGAKPTSREAARCDELIAACERATQPPNYSHDECTRILAGTAEGESRAQVEAALGPSSPEPAPCDATYLWPNMPFTPYFGSSR